MHCLVLLIIDLFVVFASTVIAVLLCSDPSLQTTALFHATVYGLLTGASAIPVFLTAGLHRTLWRFTSLQDCLKILIVSAVTTLSMVAIATAHSLIPVKPGFLIFLQFLMITSILLSVRLFMRLRHALRRQQHSETNSIEARDDIIVIGINTVTELFLRCITERGGKQVAVAGILSATPRHQGRILRSYPILGRPDDIEPIMHELEIHGIHINRVVVAVPLETLSAACRKTLLRLERELKVRLDILHHRFGLESAQKKSSETLAAITSADRAPVMQQLSTDPEKQHASPAYQFWKRGFDIATAIFSFVCLSPLMMGVATIVFLDVGYPIIFWQQRPGTRGRPIRVLKFRTMHSAHDLAGRRLADTERLSPIGRFLRRARLDELPQILNVLMGEMSIIGPRPLLPIDQSPRFVARLEVRPGLTGWAQVNGGRQLTIADKAALDLWYVRNASFAVDLRILLLTIRTVLFGERVDECAIQNAWRTIKMETVLTADRRSCTDVTPETEHWYQAAPLASAIPEPQPTQAQ